MRNRTLLETLKLTKDLKMKEIIYALWNKTAVADPTIVLEDGIVSPGVVTWLYDLVHSMSAIVYNLQNRRYTIDTTMITLAPADLVDPRIDVIAVDVNNAVVVLQGIPSPSPVKPTIDSMTQIELTYVLILANATEPDGVADEIVYDENTEWSHLIAGTVVDFDSTVDPFHGSKCASVAIIGNGDYVSFVSATPMNFADFITLSFALKLKAKLSASITLYVYFLNNGGSVSNLLRFDFAHYDNTHWQSLSHAMKDWKLSSLHFNEIRFLMGPAESAGFYLDLVKLQSGTPQTVKIDTVTLTGDVTGAGTVGNPFATTLKTVNGNVGTFGGATKSAKVTVDAKGRVTGVEEVDIEGGGGGSDTFQVHFIFDIAGAITYPCPYALKFTAMIHQQVNAPILSVALNTDMVQYDILTVTADAVGVVTLTGTWL